MSDENVEDLLAECGWGLTLPAELNGRSRPARVLELREALDLTAEQVTPVTEIFDSMCAAAIVAGEKFTAVEAALGDAFAV